MSYDTSQGDRHDRALRRLGALGDDLHRRRLRLEAQARKTGMGDSPRIPGDMVDVDSTPPRRYPIEEGEREERLATGRGFRCAFWGMVGDTPKLGPGDRQGAADFLAKITAAIEHGQWTRNEWTMLYELERRWRARAEGRDPRFEVAGTAPGRLRKAQEQRIRIERERVRQAERFSR